MHTLRLTFILPLLAMLFPALALAGTQTYTTPGTYTFTVPQYTGSLTVTAIGGGGGGGGGQGGGEPENGGAGVGSGGDDGGNGGDASFGTLTAKGGKGGCGGGSLSCTGANGGGGGGMSSPQRNSNTTGGARGGAGGAGGYICQQCLNAGWNAASGGYGEDGEKIVRTYSAGELTPGSTVTVFIGKGSEPTSGLGAGGSRVLGNGIPANGGGGGAGGAGELYSADSATGAASGSSGENGENGGITITWTAATPPPPTKNSCLVDHALFGVPGSYTFTVPAGVTQLRVFAIGGGGGGGAGAGGWGSGGGGGCGGAPAGGTMTVTPGQKIQLYVAYGGTGGNGSGQCKISGFPWCGSYYPASDGSPGGNSAIGTVVGKGGSWGRTGFYNLFNQHPGGSGGGSGGGGGGNGWPGFYATSGSGGTAGGQTNSQGAGGYCTGDGWDIDPASFISKVPFSAGAGGYSPGGWRYWGGGGGGGLVIDGSAVNGGDGQSSPNNGGKGFGGGGGGSNLDNLGVGGTGAPGAIYIEWDGGSANPNACGASCSITFEQNPMNGASTAMRWTSTGGTFFSINNAGWVGASGNSQVFTPGDYSGVVYGPDGKQVLANCSATLFGTADSCTPTSRTCNPAAKVVIDNCGNRTSCPEGCSVATNQCIVPTCPAGYTRRGGQCVRVTCPDGWTVSGNMCVPPPVVTFDRFDAFDRNGNPFRATGHLQVFPALVRQGDTTRVYWKVSNAHGCTVTGSNGDAWDTLNSGSPGKTSSVITSQTVYTLQCQALRGAVPANVRETATVNILPLFEEI